MFQALLAATLVQPTDVTRTRVVCVAPPEDEQVMLEQCRSP
jgi:hypothetical protein